MHKKNLVGDELKQCFKDCLLLALKDTTNPDKRITFKFKDFKNTDFTDFKLSYFCSFDIKGVSLNGIDLDTQLKIIINNMYYNHFALIDVSCIKGKRTCHGHGDFWGTDYYTFIFYRFEEDE